MDKGKQAPTTAEEVRECEAFEQLRNGYHMTQKEWAKAIGISYGLVKGIEAPRIKCSAKTKAKVRSFEVCYNAKDLHGLEAHILYDVLLSHMEQIPKGEADTYSARCAKALLDILSRPAEFDSPEAQKTYFEFLEQVLTTLTLALDDVATAINQGENILNVNQGLKSIFDGKQVTRFKKSNYVMVSKDGEVDWQNSLFGVG